MGVPERQKILPHRGRQNGWLECPHGRHPQNDQRLQLRWAIVHLASNVNEGVAVEWCLTVFSHAGNYFVAGCAPGADPSSSFCAQCVGSRSNIDDGTKCRPSSEEQYYGYAGAFRYWEQSGYDFLGSAKSLSACQIACSCCVSQQVPSWWRRWRCLYQTHNCGRKQRWWVLNLFLYQPNPVENSYASPISLLFPKGSGPDWAQGLNPDDYMLVCPNMKMAVPISRFADCNLAKVPAHAVVTRPEIRNRVVNILQSQEVSENEESVAFFVKPVRINLHNVLTISRIGIVGGTGGNKGCIMQHYNSWLGWGRFSSWGRASWVFGN